MKIFLLSVPYDSGHHKKRLGLGPLRIAPAVEQHLKEKRHAIRMGAVFIESSLFPTEVSTSFALSRQIADLVRNAKTNNEFPIILSGNCNTAVGTLSGLSDESGVMWFDCHGDFNTPETTTGGFLDGMALSMVAGHCWKQLTSSVTGFKPVDEENIVLIGARDLDPLEVKLLSASRITFITPSMIKEDKADFTDVNPKLKSVYLHIDLDVLDPAYLRVNTYSTEGGLLPEDLFKMIEKIKAKYSISAIAFTAYDPSMDCEGLIPTLVNQVIDLIV
jgi:arginase